MSNAQITSKERGQGTVVEDYDGKKYKILTASGGAFVNGDVVIISEGDTYGYTFESTTTADKVTVAGVVADTIASAAYGRVQIAGVHSAVKLNGGTTDVAYGDRISTGLVAKYGAKVTTVTPGCVLGVALEAATGLTSTGAVLIRLA